MPKVITGGVRELVLELKDFFMSEKKSKAPIIPLKRLNERVAAATGISLRKAARIENEGILSEPLSSEIVTQGNKVPKVSIGVREVMLKVREFFIKESKSRAPIIPFVKVNERIVAATGISLRTITRILNEGRMAEATSSKIVTPGQNRKTRKDKIIMNDFEIDFLRRTINEFYAMNEVPSLNKLLQLIKEETGFTGSREVLRKHMIMIGYQFRSLNATES